MSKKQKTPMEPIPWDKPTIELPPGWKTRIERISLEINGGRRGMMRYLWAVALDRLLELDNDTLKQAARELQRLDVDDFAGLVKRHSDDPAVAAKLAVRDNPGADSARSGRKSGGSARASG